MRSAILTTNALPAACHGLPRTSGTCRRSFQSRPVGAGVAGVAGGCPQILTVHLTLYNQGEQIIPTTSILAPTLDFQTFLRPCEDPKAVHLERNSLCALHQCVAAARTAFATPLSALRRCSVSE